MSSDDSLQDKRAEVTKDAIRAAVESILADEHPAAISVPAVAKQAGVSVRTVYRHFPSKQALLDDVAAIQMRRADKLTRGRDDLFDDPAAYLRVLWRDFASDVEAVRAQHTSKAGADLRARRLSGSRAGIRTKLDAEFPNATDADLSRLTDLLVAVPSSSMFLELHDRLGHEPDEAADLAMWMVRAAQREFARNGGFERREPG